MRPDVPERDARSSSVNDNRVKNVCGAGYTNLRSRKRSPASLRPAFGSAGDSTPHVLKSPKTTRPKRCRNNLPPNPWRASHPLPGTACQTRSLCTDNRDRSDGSHLAVDAERWYFAVLRVQAQYANDSSSPTRPLCASTHLTLRPGIKIPPRWECTECLRPTICRD